jgi:hypothetical protein
MADRTVTWWKWFTVALFLLIPVDLLTTLVAVARHGAVVEANPLTRWLLQYGIPAVTVANLVAVALAVTLFDVAVGAILRAPAPYRDRLASGVDAWLAVVFVSGVVVTANNLLVIL